MTTLVARAERAPGGGAAAGALTCALAGIAAAAAVAVIGPGAAVLPVACLAATLAFCYPRQALPALLAAGVAIDPAAIGITGPFSRALWEMPGPLATAVPFKTNPFELLVFLAAAGALVRPRLAAGWPARLPALVCAVPAVLALGALYGLANGGPANLVYHEARGLLFAGLAFFAVWRMRGFSQREVMGWTLAATTVLGLIAVFRYVFYLQNGAVDVPLEFWFAHETGLFLGVGFILGSVLVVRAGNGRERLFAIGYALLMLTAALVTGRRSAVLVLLVGAAVVFLLLTPRRPALVVAATLVGVVAGAGYLNAYWDASGTPIGEPARAIRSQVDPSARDESSDQYRRDERENIQRTLRESPVFGVGFGRPFTQYVELPVLDFWPLQSYTPHQNLLWLWLKMGIVGASVLAGVWCLALGRLLRVLRGIRRSEVPAATIVLAATLVMYAAYARIDLAFVGSRAAVPLAVALALAFLADPRREGEPRGNR